MVLEKASTREVLCELCGVEIETIERTRRDKDDVLYELCGVEILLLYQEQQVGTKVLYELCGVEIASFSATLSIASMFYMNYVG